MLLSNLLKSNSVSFLCIVAHEADKIDMQFLIGEPHKDFEINKFKTLAILDCSKINLFHHCYVIS